MLWCYYGSSSKAIGMGTWYVHGFGSKAAGWLETIHRVSRKAVWWYQGYNGRGSR